MSSSKVVELEGPRVAEVLTRLVDDVQEAARASHIDAGTRLTVDLEVTLNSLQVTKDGTLKAFFTKATSVESTMTMRLATRVTVVVPERDEKKT